MKKALFILFAVSALAFASCTKEANTELTNPIEGTETITLTATIDIPAATKAALDGLAINWESGDYIGIATDNSAKIVAYPVTPDGTDATKCTVTIATVPGATAYYALFKGRLGGDTEADKEAYNDFSKISFNTTTKTFSGLTVGNQQVASGSLSSYVWHTSGYPLAMAGKVNGTSLVMKPCLALAKIQIHSDSVPSDYLGSEVYTSTYSVDHNHSYSAVRGFNLYQKGGSTIYSSGNFTVTVANDGTLTTTATDTKEYRQISQSGKLAADTPYYMCLIPGGSITSFYIDFLGYKDNTGGLSWDAVYSMNLPCSTTVQPGDFFDLGKLNPLALKRAKDHADDEAYDATSATYVPAVEIDGGFTDWASVASYPGTRTSGSSNSRIAEWKLTGDELNIYLYLKLANEKFAVTGTMKPNSYIYVCFDMDNNDATGSTRTSIPGVDQYALIYPCVADSNPVTFINGADPRSQMNGSSDGTLETWGVFDTVETAYSHVELCVPRSKIGSPASGSSIKVGVSFQEYDAAKQSITLK